MNFSLRRLRTTCRPPTARSRPFLIRTARVIALVPLPVLVAACGGGGGGSGPPKPIMHTIGGTASGLAGTPLTLVLNGGAQNEEITVRANGAFVFPTPVPSGAAYTVAAKSQRVSAQQNCFVTGSTATGIVGNADVTSVAVVCLTLGRFVYVGTTGGGGLRPSSVAAYTLDGSTGFLTPAPGSSVTFGSQPLSISVDPAGKFLYVVTYRSSDVSAYAIDRATGALTALPGSPFSAPGCCLYQTEIDPSGRFLYVAAQTDTGGIGSIYAFTIDATTGALTPVPGSPYDIGGAIVAGRPLTIDPAGQFLYINTANTGIQLFSIDGSTGALKPVGNTSPFYSAYCLSIGPSGRFAYVKGLSEVWIYAIDPTTHSISLNSNSPFPTALDTGCFTIDPTGRLAYLNNIGSTHGDYFSGYAIDAASGVLTPIAGSPFGIPAFSGPIAFDPSGAYAFQVSPVANTIAVYDMSKGDGVPGPVAYSPFSVSASPGPVVISP
jgi:6-phosphogluconolactonase